jgi:hypothetical protein
MRLKTEIVSQRKEIRIRRHILQPGEALPWHTDRCQRFSVVIRGDALRIEYRDADEVETIAVCPGMAEWDQPQARVHRGLNSGQLPFEEVVIFFLGEPNIEPQPTVE